VSRVVILGSGAAPGVPSLSNGFGDCNPDNPKNIRLRAGTYIELDGVKLLIDTSPDLRTQLLNSHIRETDAVLYTHVHADHLHGIDDLREINRITEKAIDTFASPKNMEYIRLRFDYLLTKEGANINPIYKAALIPHEFEYNKSFIYKGVKITPILLEGHNIEVSGYIFNDGEVVHVADFHHIKEEDLALIKRQPEVLIMPLTTPKGTKFHASMEDLLNYNAQIKPKKMVINHMASECDYDAIKAQCVGGMVPAYDGLEISW